MLSALRTSPPYNLRVPYTMELLVPAIAAGGMYLASRQERELGTQVCAKKASASNAVAEPLPNYPDSTPVTARNDVNFYASPNAATDKYFQQESAIERQGAVSGQYMLLSGQKTDAADFTHNNMQPFFGGTIKQPRTMPRGNESRLDNMSGAGSQYVKKTEKAPLFQPRPDAHWANGAPSSTDFVQSRQVAPMSRNNDKPWESVQVGPGLNDGFGNTGVGGFNSGMGSREMWAPKTVDQLRAETNPKCTFAGVTLGGKHFAGRRGVEGVVQKNHPDTAYELGPDRYFTTQGAEAGPSGRPTQQLPPQARTETTRDFYGVGAAVEGGAHEVRGTYEDPKREALASNAEFPGAAVSIGGGAANASTADHGREGHTNRTTSRSLTGERSAGLVGSAIAAVKSLIVPFQEQLRPTRKEDVVHNPRQNGAAATGVASATARSHVDQPRITRREQLTCTGTPQRGAQSSVNAQRLYSEQAMHTNRGETSREFTPGGGATGSSSKPMDTSSAYAGARGADKESTLIGRTNQGAGALFTGQYAPVRPTNRIDHAHHAFGVGSQIGEPPTASTIGAQSHRASLHTGTAERLHDNVQAQFSTNPYSHSVM